MSRNMKKRLRGFTLIELMIVVAIIGILATLAMPTFQDRVIRAQVSEALNLAEFVKQSVGVFYARNHRMPRDNAEAGLPDSSHIVGNYVTDVATHGGVIVVTMGNRSNAHVEGKKLALRPAVVEGYPVVPIAWVCGNASAPVKMKLIGQNETTLPALFLPLDCR
jgi:type IV pilus assembly protein PilA